MYCNKCGTPNPDTAAYCKSCANPLNRARAANPYVGRPVSEVPVPAGPGANAGGSALGGTIAKIAGVAVVAIVAVIIAVVAIGGIGGGGGRASSDQLAQDLSKSFNQMVSSGLTESAIQTAYADVVDMMPSAAVDAALAKNGRSRSDISSLMSDYISSSSLSSYASYLDKMSIEFSFYVGDALSSSEIDSINSGFQSANVDLHATSGNELGMRVTISVLEDVQGASKGDSGTQTFENTGMTAVNIDGNWYLWISSMQW